MPTAAATAARTKSVCAAPSMLFNIVEDQDAALVELSPSAISETVRTLSSPPRKVSRSSSRPGAVSSATTVQSNDDLGDSQHPTFGFRPRRRRARSRKPSIYATWSCGGVSLSNAALRLLTSAATIPAIVAAVVLTPRLALAFFCAAVVCIGAYEFAWLAFHIHRQLLVTYNYYECSDRNRQPDADVPFPSVVSGHTTQTTMSFSTGTYSAYTHNERDSFEDPMMLTTDASGQCPTRQTRAATSALDPADVDSAPDLLASVATTWFRGRVVVARVVIALPLAALWSIATHLLYTSTTFPVAAVPQAFSDAPYFLWAVNLLATVCTLAAPNGPAALALVAQKEVFTVLLLNSVNCPLSSSACEAARPALTPLQTLIVGVLLLLVLRSITAASPADFVVASMLDVLGFVYIVGTLGLLAAVVDTSDDASDVFVNVLLLLLGVVWTAELAGYVCDAVMYHFRWYHVQLFPSWLALKFDIEAAICSTGVGAAAMLVGCEVLHVPGALLAKVACALVAVLAGRLGRLFLSLLKKAAGVRWSSYLLPGYGGLLDAVSMLLFATLVFAQYFLYVGTLLDAAARRIEDDSAPTGGATITFTTRLGGP